MFTDSTHGFSGCAKCLHKYAAQINPEHVAEAASGANRGSDNAKSGVL